MIERNRGIIINMGGGVSVRPLAGAAGYGCSESALLRLTDTWRRRWNGLVRLF